MLLSDQFLKAKHDQRWIPEGTRVSGATFPPSQFCFDFPVHVFLKTGRPMHSPMCLASSSGPKPPPSIPPTNLASFSGRFVVCKPLPFIVPINHVPSCFRSARHTQLSCLNQLAPPFTDLFHSLCLVLVLKSFELLPFSGPQLHPFPFCLL